MSQPVLNPRDLELISRGTIADYDQRAEDFWAGTRDHDVRQNIEALLSAIDGSPPFSILDFGCRPGRDLTTFAAPGHEAIGIDGSPCFVQMARARSGCVVWPQDFLALDLPPGRFDGIFANASLFHVPRQELPRVLRALAATLRPPSLPREQQPWLASVWRKTADRTDA